MGGDGEALQRLTHLGRRYAAWIRISALPPITVVGVVAAPPRQFLVTVVTLGIVVAVSLAYVVAQFRDGPAWVSMLDAAALASFGLGTKWVVPVEWLAGGKSWLVPLLTASCLAYQYHLPWHRGALFAVLVHGALGIGLALGIPPGAPPFGVISVVWSLAISVLARLLWSLVEWGGRNADSAMAEAAAARTAQRVAAATRADERATAAALHDTAATTLLMVGLDRSLDEEVLRRQARRDLEVLGTFEQRPPEHRDLLSSLRDIAVLGDATLHLQCPPVVPVPGQVAEAVTGAVREALTNVGKHAAATTTTVRVASDEMGTCLEVVVTDDGHGFDTTAVPPTRHGLRRSIQGRMAAVDGYADVQSTIGTGTTITLRWSSCHN
ncbi:hypothetical protein BS329_17970 [Amycolatopsis coloradensis]|uniref:histidine kinase n=1 Tax=Amycolatopsis coloradensis TaxID=76021 RepID=A0A1R0KT21_9PSEU|nr:ATP-binding protein [Amycolatopsis coloradensis]OLZ51128.1 hypothetical protein BS329_17970 [Amycolatopsis coloradensis]